MLPKMMITFLMKQIVKKIKIFLIFNYLNSHPHLLFKYIIKCQKNQPKINQRINNLKLLINRLTPC